jgi:hypothetical protein
MPAMDYKNRGKMRLFIDKGVKISNSLTVDIGEKMDIDRVSGGGMVEKKKRQRGSGVIEKQRSSGSAQVFWRS